jgi:hypothetical protein
VANICDEVFQNDSGVAFMTINTKLFPFKPSAIRTIRIFGLMTVLPIISVGHATLSRADTAIETETAQLGKKGDIGISQAYEYGRAKDGTSGGTLTQFEYAISDRAEILVEPFFYTWDHPKGESKVDGFGDLEITPSYEVLQEDGWTPTIIAAVKVKAPTGSKKAGSSGKFDYMPYLIFGKQYGGWIFNANLGMNFVTQEDGGGFDRTATWALEAQREFAPNWTGFVEAFSTEDHVKTASTALEYEWNEHVNTFGAVGYTEDHEGIFRLGINFEY